MQFGEARLGSDLQSQIYADTGLKIFVTGTLAGGPRIVGLAERRPSDHGRQ